MAGIDDNMTMMGEWLPSPSPRTFFSAMLGDDISSREPPSEDRGGELFLGSQQQMRSGNSDRKETGASSDQLNEVGPFSELRSSSRGGLVERMAARAGFNAPRLNTESIRSSDLSLNPDVRSPYLMISPGLSPTTLLESPVFVSNSLVSLFL
jgi:WRKY transcription factor 2